MEEKKDGFFMYRSYFEAIETAEDDSTKLKLYNAIMHYGMDGIEPELSGLARGMFLTWKVNIDNGHARRVASIENGNKGGRPKKVEDKLKNNQNKPNNNLSQNTNNQINPKVNLEVPEPNLNNNINHNSEIENDVEESFNSLEQVSEQVFMSNIISDDPLIRVIGDNMIDKLDQQFQFNNRYNILINENPSTDFDEIIEILLIEFNGIFDTVNVQKMKLQPFTSYKTYQKLVRNKTEPKVIFYEMVKSLQYILSDDDPRMSLYISKQ
jgi:hypothetical protein